MNEPSKRVRTYLEGVTPENVDVTGRKGFGGHGIGSAEPFINSTGPEAFHPNIHGNRAYAKAISAQLRKAGWTDKHAVGLDHIVRAVSFDLSAGWR